MPQANSTTSRPREISPRASECTLPCSRVMISASSSLRESSSSRNRNITLARVVIEARRQVAAAAFAEAMTASASAWSATTIRPVTCPVAGLVTSRVFPDVPACS